ncbi:hypothetical protein U9M48_022943 [Paspalum notatum var. saurae]|uniref:PGG domain-containing protein n=1 Tax=Paspalum notatum var. saurae TaxID=547442 RepID=A0AAQ3WVN3_PASNO
MGDEAGAGAGRPEVEEKADVGGDPWEYRLRKYLLLLATLVATVTYSSAFNPPGGVWQQDADDPAANRNSIAGDPVIMETSRPRYLAFFYLNATAFASSLVVIVLVLILAVLHERRSASLAPLRILRVVMVLDLFSLMGAYAAGAFRDRLTAIYSLVLLACAVVYLAVHMLLAWYEKTTEKKKNIKSAPDHHQQQHLGVGDVEKKREEEKRKEEKREEEEETETALEKLRKVLMLLGTFAVSVTYAAGLSAPGGFWDDPDHDHEGVHRPGDAVLKGGPHDKRLKAFFVLNTTAFVASLLVIVILLEKKLCFSKSVRSAELYGFIAVMLVGLVGAYSAGSCRKIDTTIYVNSLIGAVIAFVLLQAAIIKICKDVDAIKKSCLWEQLRRIRVKVKGLCFGKAQGTQNQNTTGGNEDGSQQIRQVQLEKARSLVLLLATLAAAITYQAGLSPPGGLWQSDGDRGGGHYMAGDPILLTMSPRRYKAFYYCNSVALVASVVAIALVRMETLHHHNALEAAMILDLFGLIGAYAAGSCRDVATSIYAMALAGAVLVYVVIHVVFFTLDHSAISEAELVVVEKRRKRLLLFAILAATITYQAGLTPPAGFLDEDDPDKKHLAGDPVLLHNFPRRYAAFFYCNSVSFMLSIALIILLVNPNLYRPAIRSNALSVCTAAGMIGIMGAYAAGCTQHLKTSIYIFALAGFVLAVAVVAVASLAIHDKKHPHSNKQNKTADVPTDEQPRAAGDIESTGAHQNPSGAADQPKSNATTGGDDTMKPKKVKDDTKKKQVHAKRKYLMLLGILVASVTYQAGLAPPGGVWQDDDKRHAAGDPVMHDNRRSRYLAFYYSNSASFVASVVVIVVLLLPDPPQPPQDQQDNWWWQWRLGLMKTTIVLDLLGLLVAYAAGSSRSWKTAGNVSALVIAVLAYFVIHVAVSCFVRRSKNNKAPLQ